MKIFVLCFVLAVASAKRMNTVNTLAGDDRFSTLVSLVKSAGLVDTLNGGNFTIFAPTNDAFKMVPADVLAMLQANTTLLTDVLLYHVLGGWAPSTVAANDLETTMANGKEARVNVYTHNHKITIQGAVVIQPDLMCSNGIIHVISSVMMAPMDDVVSYVVANSQFSTLLSLVQKAGLASALQKDNLTLFAPTNDAFAKLTSQQVADITGDMGKLSAVLTYHVVGSTVYSAGLYDKEVVSTLNTNDMLTVNLKTGVMINTASVTAADIGVTNGVIHVIDTVLVPLNDPALTTVG
ncbi:hypothetical protein ACF0H5_021207 [Mactra antiquata]